jgi:2-oxoacid:acceptor oxidoreductase gamma subunit (pyruvate/2-ketoisovalerate family)
VYEIRIHGFGGEGVVKLSEMIGKTATRCDKWAHSLPFFGTEVRGAAVKAFARVSRSPIHIKSYIYEPDIIVITNDMLLNDPDTVKGLKKEGVLIVNTTRGKDDLRVISDSCVHGIDATEIAYNIYGKPIVNVIIFGALLGVKGLFPLATAAEVVSEEFGEKNAKLNTSALTQGYEEMKKVG